jgi:hypothetical protein
MAMPALLSLEFSPHSRLYTQGQTFDWAQALISADGVRHLPGLAPGVAGFLWFSTLFVGLMVLLPSQMSVVEDVSRRWTDVIWSASSRVRETARQHHVKTIYYTILAAYVGWCAVSLQIFGRWGTPKLMTLVISNLGNVALGFTSLLLLWVNFRLLPRELRPRWYNALGVAACGVFYLGLAALVFAEKQVPLIRELWASL